TTSTTTILHIPSTDRPIQTRTTVTIAMRGLKPSALSSQGAAYPMDPAQAAPNIKQNSGSSRLHHDRGGGGVSDASGPGCFGVLSHTAGPLVAERLSSLAGAAAIPWCLGTTSCGPGQVQRLVRRGPRKLTSLRDGPC